MVSFLIAGTVRAGQPGVRACRRVIAVAVSRAHGQVAASRSRRRRPPRIRRPAVENRRSRSRLGSQERACPVSDDPAVSGSLALAAGRGGSAAGQPGWRGQRGGPLRPRGHAVGWISSCQAGQAARAAAGRAGPARATPATASTAVRTVGRAVCARWLASRTNTPTAYSTRASGRNGRATQRSERRQARSARERRAASWPVIACGVRFGLGVGVMSCAGRGTPSRAAARR